MNSAYLCPPVSPIQSTYALEVLIQINRISAAALPYKWRNSEEMLAELGDIEQRERQAEITRQVLELIAARFGREQ